MSGDMKDIADALVRIAKELRNLGNADAATPMGAIEGIGALLKEDVADALRSTAAAEVVAEALSNIADPGMSGIADEIDKAGRRISLSLYALARAVAKVHIDWDALIEDIDD